MSVKVAALFIILENAAMMVLLYDYLSRRLKKMAVDLTAEFAKLDASIAALPARIAAAEANAIQPADVQAAADARAAQIDALNLPPAPTA